MYYFLSDHFLHGKGFLEMHMVYKNRNHTKLAHHHSHICVDCRNNPKIPFLTTIGERGKEAYYCIDINKAY